MAFSSTFLTFFDKNKGKICASVINQIETFTKIRENLTCFSSWRCDDSSRIYRSTEHYEFQSFRRLDHKSRK